jgi:hypothetical protein
MKLLDDVPNENRQRANIKRGERKVRGQGQHFRGGRSGGWRASSCRRVHKSIFV